ncbi:MAG: PilZ domain-containing protein [Terriglobales bacterium]
MDPHIYPGQPGLSPDSSDGEEGVNYLRRLKGKPAEDAPADAAVKSGGGPATTPTVAWKERRQSPRLRCSGSAEFRAEGSDVRMWGTLTDVSLHGCYMEMNTTFPVGTKVDLVLKSFGIRIQARGTVRTSYPFLGMGICFAEIEPGQKLQLTQLLDALAVHNAVSNGGSARESGMKGCMGTVDPRAFLNEITEFFRKNQLLSREEFHEIAKRVRRP